MGRNSNIGHFREIDALRGIAASIVAFFVHQHFLLGNARLEPFGPFDQTPLFIRYGETMVDLFFVISGFVFTHTYYRGRDGLRGSSRDFIMARIARLYPLHVATALVMFALLPLGGFAFEETPHDFYHLLLNLLMLQESGLESGISLNRAAWSLSLEIYCYAAFLIVVTTFKGKAKPVFACLAACGFLLFILLPSQTTEAVGRAFVGYFMGCLLYLHRSQMQAISRPLLVVLVLLTPLIAHGPIHPGFMMSVLAWPALISLSSGNAMLQSRTMQWLGERSYSIYMLHVPVYLLVATFLFNGNYPPAHFAFAGIVLVAVLTLLVSHFSYDHFELPMRNRIKRRKPPLSPTIA